MKYEIADKVFEIISIHEDIHLLCKDYATDKTSDFFLQSTQADIDFERKKSQAENAKEGKPVIDYSEGYLETLAIYRKIAKSLIHHDTFLFHGSCVAVDNAGYLFTAKSGTGKSTHTKLWREYLGKRVVMVNDDKPLIKITQNNAIVYGTPWNGKHHLGENISVPLKAICILERGSKNKITTITKSQAFPALLQQVYRPTEPNALKKTLKLLDCLSNKVKLYHLECTMDIAAAKTAYDAMKGIDGNVCK